MSSTVRAHHRRLHHSSGNCIRQQKCRQLLLLLLLFALLLCIQMCVMITVTRMMRVRIMHTILLLHIVGTGICCGSSSSCSHCSGQSQCQTVRAVAALKKQKILKNKFIEHSDSQFFFFLKIKYYKKIFRIKSVMVLAFLIKNFLLNIFFLRKIRSIFRIYPFSCC